MLVTKHKLQKQSGCTLLKFLASIVVSTKGELSLTYHKIMSILRDSRQCSSWPTSEEALVGPTGLRPLWYGTHNTHCWRPGIPSKETEIPQIHVINYKYSNEWQRAWKWQEEAARLMIHTLLRTSNQTHVGQHTCK